MPEEPCHAHSWHRDSHGPARPWGTQPPSSHPAAGFVRFGRGFPPRGARSCRLRPVPGSVGSSADTGLFIVGSRRAGAPWQRRSLGQSWRQDGHLHGDPVHVLGWAGGIYLFAGLFSLVLIKQPAPGTTASPFWSAAGHGSSGESRAGEGVRAAWQGWGTQPVMPARAAWAQGGTPVMALDMSPASPLGDVGAEPILPRVLCLE